MDLQLHYEQVARAVDDIRWLRERDSLVELYPAVGELDEHLEITLIDFDKHLSWEAEEFVDLVWLYPEYARWARRIERLLLLREESPDILRAAFRVVDSPMEVVR